MEQVLSLKNYGSKQLWTRDLARQIRADLNTLLENAGVADVVVINASQIEVFDYSFANELFGKSLLSLSNEFPGRFLIVENLTEYTRENLVKALESLSLVMIERKGKRFNLLGKIHPAFEETLKVIQKSKNSMTASMVKDALNINPTAANERLSKLVAMGLILREKGTSTAGREQYVYSTVR